MAECEERGKRSTHRPSLVRSLTTCEGGKDHNARMREELVFQLLEETGALRPCRGWHPPEVSGISV